MLCKRPAADEANTTFWICILIRLKTKCGCYAPLMEFQDSMGGVCVWSPSARQCTLRVVSLQLCQCGNLSYQNSCGQNEQSPTNSARVNEFLNGLLYLESHHTANMQMQTQRTLFQLLVGEGHSLW